MAHSHPGVKAIMLKLKENCGYSKANNLGVKKAAGQYVVLLSNDIRVSRDWLKNAIAKMELDEQIGVAQSMMYTLDNPLEHDPMGNYIDAFGFNHPLSPSNELKEVFYCEGAVMFIRKKVIHEAFGLFDESYFMFYEDVDFCWRVRLMGYKVVVLPESIVYHKRGGTVSGILMKTDSTYVTTNTRNRLNTLLKNYSVSNVIKFAPLSTVIEISKSLLLVLNGKVQASLACFKGIASVIFGMQNTMKKRAVIQKKRKITNDKEIQKFIVPTRVAFSDTIANVKRLQSEWKKQ
jgi:GT2 family glycosyltransferase